MNSKLGSAEEVLRAQLAEVDPEISEVLQQELRRQRDTLEMIASENFAPNAVLEAQGPMPMFSLTRELVPVRLCCTPWQSPGTLFSDLS